MSPNSIMLILISIILTSGSQIVLKFGMMSGSVQIALASHKSSEIALAIISSPFIIGGLICFGLSAIIWLFVLSKIPVSSAYPFIALGIVATTFFGHFMFNEPITAYKALGLCLILSGILLIGKVG